MSGMDDLIKGATGGGGGLGEILSGLAGDSGAGSGGLGDLLGGILGGGAAGSPGRAAGVGGLGGMLASLLPMVGSMLSGGGLQNILSGLRADGLSAQADSWIGTGTNAPVSGAEIRGAIGGDEIARIAEKLGVSEDEAAEAIAQVLPAVVDQVSPDGRLEPDEKLASAFGTLEHLDG